MLICTKKSEKRRRGVKSMIEVTNLNKVYDNGFEALKSVSFNIDKGDLVCLLGPSGCGKSTILNMIAGLLQPTNGDIAFDGKSIVHTEPKDRNIGFVFQNYSLYPHMTVLQNVMFPLSVGNHKVDKKVALATAEKYMKLTKISDIRDKRPGQLSGGQQQRVAITRALVQNPQVLLLDEPLSNLDARLRLSIREEIRRLVKEVGITTIFVTHDQEEALSISDKIILLNDGVVQQDDDPQKLYLEPNNLFVAQFIGNPVINLLPVRISEGKIQSDFFAVPLTEFKQERFKAPLEDGTYVLGIRPEDMMPNAANPLFESVLIDGEAIGRERVLKFDLGEHHFKAIMKIEEHVTKGLPMNFNFKKEKAFIFEESGERVY